MQTKTCSKCLTKKALSEFNKSKSNNDGRNNTCKTCRQYYYQENRESILEKVKRYNREHKLERNIYNKQYYKENKEVFGKYRKENREKIRTNQNKRYKNNLNYKLKRIFSERVRGAIKKQSTIKSHKSNELLGCTIEEVKIHLESQFTEGMSWENHGEWHIDHIKPCACFDLTDPEQQKECFHYTNLQPLWAKDNLSKSDKWNR